MNCSIFPLFLYGFLLLFVPAIMIFGEIQSWKMRKFYREETKRFNDAMIAIAKEEKGKK